MTRRAAQYLRASSSKQPLSLQEQKLAIARYAHEHRIDVVATYADDARTGITLAGRDAMQQLLKDVMEADRRFDLVLVLDVSRWGRFQDLDEAAYHEYHCRKNGVQVVYVGEAVPVSRTPFDSLFKQIRRAAAAEYSRDLASKSRAGQVHVINMGFAVGKMPCFGYRRESVSADGARVKTLEYWEGKPTPTDRVRWRLGPEQEILAVQRVFREYVAGVSLPQIAARANQAGLTSHKGAPVSVHMISALLRSEVVTGRFSWGLRGHSSHARTDISRLPTPANNAGMVPRIVDEVLWQKAQAKLRKASARHVHHYTNERLVQLLRDALVRDPELSTRRFPILGLPSFAVYRQRFGGLRAAYAAAGRSADECERLARRESVDSRGTSQALCRHVATQIAEQLPGTTFDGRSNRITVAQVSIRVLPARKLPAVRDPHWDISASARVKPGEWILIFRLRESGTAYPDCHLVPPHELPTLKSRLNLTGLRRLTPYRERTCSDLIDSILALHALHADS